MRVRTESPADRDLVHRVHARAFPSDAEARLVDALRELTEPHFSLVAELRAGDVVGHILFTPVEVHSDSNTFRAMGLGPMAVLPSRQRQGVGSALVEAGLVACRAAGELIVVVLGHPSFYPRFGFRPAWDRGLYYIAPGPNAAFMVAELECDALQGRSGEVLYHAAFDAL
jgi:putative acetyltransferase